MKFSSILRSPGSSEAQNNNKKKESKEKKEQKQKVCRICRFRRLLFPWREPRICVPPTPYRPDGMIGTSDRPPRVGGRAGQFCRPRRPVVRSRRLGQTRRVHHFDFRRWREPRGPHGPHVRGPAGRGQPPPLRMGTPLEPPLARRHWRLLAVPPGRTA